MIPKRRLGGVLGLPGEGHPRPQRRRAPWWSLDGTWDVALDIGAAWRHPDDVVWNGTITVPFAPESRASGVGYRGYLQGCWYRRWMKAQTARRHDDRTIIHFGAVDHIATVWIDGSLIGRHEGGYTPFSFDVTRELNDGKEHELVVRAEDDPLDLGKPRGKQDWEREPHSIWYDRTTGIWQTVWMERVGATSIGELHWHSNLHRLRVEFEARIDGPIPEGLVLGVRLTIGDRVLVDDTIGVRTQRLARAFRLDATGLDHLREALFWSPEHPSLVDAVLELRNAQAEIIERVFSYTAIRQVQVGNGRFLLNGRPYPLRLVLDQGYWEHSGLTPPSDGALRRDVEIVKAMGFNGVRKHQKIEDPRYLYWADRLGLLVWAEMPPAYQFNSIAVRRVAEEWARAVERDRSHPCIVVWVPFNESTGVLGLPDREDQRHWVRAMTELTKSLDPTRPVVSNDGWETLGGDIIAVHDYEQDPERLRGRWTGDLRRALIGYAPHGRLQTLDEDPADWTSGRPDRPVVLSEFGGIGWAPAAQLQRVTPTEAPADRLAQPAAWGYSSVSSAAEFAARYRSLLEAVHAADGLAGFCYTQLADTYQEVNGLLRADRTPKIPIADIAAATLSTARADSDGDAVTDL